MRNLFGIVFIGALMMYSCSNNASYAPKPKGYARVIYPEKKYQWFENGEQYTFKYPVYAEMQPDKNKDALPGWYNLNFDRFNARVHLTYYPVLSIEAFDRMVEDARKLAFKHTVKASAIDQVRINYPENKVYGIYYEIVGNTASSVQFFLTDSTKRYFRGALYFNERPQYDSIEPVVKFIRKDIDTLIKSFKWKN